MVFLHLFIVLVAAAHCREIARARMRTDRFFGALPLARGAPEVLPDVFLIYQSHASMLHLQLGIGSWPSGLPNCTILIKGLISGSSRTAPESSGLPNGQVSRGFLDSLGHPGLPGVVLGHSGLSGATIHIHTYPHIYLRIHIQIRTHTQIQKHIRLSQIYRVTYPHILVFVFIFLSLHLCTYSHVHTHLQLHIHPYIQLQFHMHIHIPIHIHTLYIYTLINISTYLSIYIYIHLYIYTHTHFHAHIHTHKTLIPTNIHVYNRAERISHS